MLLTHMHRLRMGWRKTTEDDEHRADMITMSEKAAVRASDDLGEASNRKERFAIAWRLESMVPNRIDRELNSPAPFAFAVKLTMSPLRSRTATLRLGSAFHSVCRGRLANS